MTDDCFKKLTRMQILEKERKHRIFNEKRRLIGVDKLALDNQFKEKQRDRQILEKYEDVLQRNLNFFSEQAVQQEQIARNLAYKEAENRRQITNVFLAKEQKSRNNRIKAENFANVPTDDYYNYFNSSSR